MMGMMPQSMSVDSVLRTFRYRFLSVRSLIMRRSCATYRPYFPNALEYTRISLLCPIAAAACFWGMLFNLPVIPILCLPEAMAPDVTITTLYPSFVRCAISSTSCSIICRSRPSSPVNTALPILMRTRLTFATVAFRAIIFKLPFYCEVFL